MNYVQTHLRYGILCTRQSSSEKAVIGPHGWVVPSAQNAEVGPKKSTRLRTNIPKFPLERVRVHLLAGCRDAVHADQHADSAGAYAACAPALSLASAGPSSATERGGSTTTPLEAAGYSWPRACNCAHRNKTTTGEASSEERICWRCFFCLSRCPEFKPHVAPLSPSGCARWYRQRLILVCRVIRDYDPHLPQGCRSSSTILTEA